MTKYYGAIGFAETVDKGHGVWDDEITEKFYYGDVIKTSRRLQSSEYGINKDVQISNTISIVADAYINNNMDCMRYIVFQGVKWVVTNIEVQRPRLLLTIGGIYNE